MMQMKSSFLSLRKFFGAAFASWLAVTGMLLADINVDDIKGVYCGESPSSPEKDACQFIISGMKSLYGLSLKTLSGMPEDGGVIIVGRDAAVKAGLVTQKEMETVGLGGYIIRGRDNKLAVAGENPYATVQGAGAFLGKLGSTGYSDGSGGTRVVVRIDEPKSRVLPALDISSKPALPYRIYVSRPEWAEADKALDIVNPELRGKTDLWVDHSAGFLVPKDVYYDAHPEYYAMQADGKRIAKNAFTYHRTPLCLSNPDVITISIERMLKWIELQPEKVYFPITYGDVGLWCQCDNCKKLESEPGENAARLLHWVNAVAEAVGKKHPDKIFMTFAYGGSDKPPANIKPAPNVWMIASVGLGATPYFDHDLAAKKISRRDIDKLDGWLKIAPGRVAVCEYLSDVYMPAMVDTTAGRMKWYAEKGIRGIVFSFGNPSAMLALWNYVYPKLMWDPSLDTKLLARDFALNYYGPAGKDMADYLELVHNRYRETLKNPPQRPSYVPEFTEKAVECFKRALKAAEGDAKLLSELKSEMKAFVVNWMVNPVSKEFDDVAKADLRRQLESLLAMTGDDARSKIDFARQTHRIGIAADKTQKGALALVEAWLAEKNLPKPKGIVDASGVLLPAEVFMYAGFGPQYYHGGHVAAPCPEKMAVAVYFEGNGANRSHRMVAEFELDSVLGDGSARLDIHGQDCDHDVDVSEIEILINGTSIFKGPVTLVKWNWSLQSFDIPKGILKKGLNTLEIKNAVDPSSVKHWHDRWFMLTEAAIRFTSGKGR